jgi:glutamine amidotransferase
VTQPTVVVLDYGSGNVHSVAKAVAAAGANVVLSADPQQVASAHGLIVPGVGAFAAVMDQLAKVKGAQLIERRLVAGNAVLGICVGQQVMFEQGVEHGVETEGLGQWPGVVEKLDAPMLPHMGWNTVSAPEDSVLFDGIRDERFYFVHSYGVKHFPPLGGGAFAAPKITYGNYGGPFVAAVENGPLASTQFHPEKSGQAGIRLLTNWVNSF